MRASFALFSMTDAMQVDGSPSCCCSSSCACVTGVALLLGRFEVAAGVQRLGPPASVANLCLLTVGENMLSRSLRAITSHDTAESCSLVVDFEFSLDLHRHQSCVVHAFVVLHAMHAELVTAELADAI